MLIVLLALLFSSQLCHSQQDGPQIQFNQINKDVWVQYVTQNGVILEYKVSDWESSTGGYNGVYLIFRISNQSNSLKTVAWDFSYIDSDGTCINCSGVNGEYRQVKNIKQNSTLEKNIEDGLKENLKYFICFDDPQYPGEKVQPWNSFKLRNLYISN